MFKNVKAQIERKNDLITRAETIVNTAEVEKRELTDAEAQELAEIRDDVKKIKEKLEIIDDIDDARAEGEATSDARACEDGTDERSIEEMEYNAFDNLLRGALVHERANELAPANNGAIIPKTIARKIIELVYDICPILDKADKYTVKGALDIPYYPANGQVQIAVDYQQEFSALTSSTGNFTTISLGGFLAGALTKVSRSLVNNVDFDLVGFVVKRMAYDIARWIEKELINGTANKIEGLSGATNVVTAGSTSAITADELIALQGKVKDVYQDNAIWIMNPATRDALRTLKDREDRYLLNDNLSAPFGKTLLGKPVYVSDNAPVIGAGKRAIFYGDMSGLAVKFSEELNVEVLRERYADEHCIGVIGWVELDAKVEDQQKISVLVMPAS
jgi:HK97 family phage major capsid protein